MDGPKNKSSNFVFTTKMVVPKSLKFRNSGSEVEVCLVFYWVLSTVPPTGLSRKSRVAFSRLLSAPLLKVDNFWWFNGKPSGRWQKVKVLTSKQTAPRFFRAGLGFVCGSVGPTSPTLKQP